MSAEYAGLVVVVTGGASGIGRACADEFLARGARVVVLDREVDGVPDAILAIRCDVTDREGVQTAVGEVVAHEDGIDVLVNNAGISAVGTVEENDDEQWSAVLDVNVVGIARVSAAALPHLRQSPHAAIINMCSVAALNGLPQRALYSASKGAVLALTYAMATDHVAEGIRVNAVSPGTVRTAFVDRMLTGFPDPVAERAALDARQATGRMVSPEEVAVAVAYLASPLAGSTTGTALDVDGGMTHLRPRRTQALADR